LPRAIEYQWNAPPRLVPARLAARAWNPGAFAIEAARAAGASDAEGHQPAAAGAGAGASSSFIAALPSERVHRPREPSPTEVEVRHSVQPSD